VIAVAVLLASEIASRTVSFERRHGVTAIQHRIALSEAARRKGASIVAVRPAEGLNATVRAIDGRAGRRAAP
jgi:hypothetical protein